MLFRARKDVIGRPLKGSDEAIGKIRDLLVADGTWNVRHAVIDADWLDAGKVLLRPECFGPLDFSVDDVVTPLTRHQVEMSPPADADDDPRLHSAEGVRGYHIAAIDGEIGHVEDLLVVVPGWRVAGFLVDTRNWLPGRHVVIRAEDVEAIDDEARRVRVRLPRQVVKDAPEFDAAMQIGPSYEVALANYYRNSAIPPVTGGGGGGIIAPPSS